MMSKVAILLILASVAVGHGANLHSEINTKIVPLEKEGRVLLEIPIIGTIILKSFKVIWFLLSSAWSLIGLKLTALALAANAVFWVFKNGLTVVFGAVAAFGFCKLTGKCSLDYVPRELLQVGETLVDAARNLEEGEMTYGSSIH